MVVASGSTVGALCPLTGGLHLGLDSSALTGRWTHCGKVRPGPWRVVRIAVGDLSEIKRQARLYGNDQIGARHWLSAIGAGMRTNFAPIDAQLVSASMSCASPGVSIEMTKLLLVSANIADVAPSRVSTPSPGTPETSFSKSAVSRAAAQATPLPMATAGAGVVLRSRDETKGHASPSAFYDVRRQRHLLAKRTVTN